MKVILSIVFSLLLGEAVPASAHHSFAAEFDAAKCSETTGILTKVDYQNPHAYLWVNAAKASGQIEEMTFQLSSPVGVHGLLRNGGWKTKALSGWTLNGTFSATTGTPLTAYVSGNLANTGGLRALLYALSKSSSFEYRTPPICA